MIKVMQIGFGYWGKNVAKKIMLSKELSLVYLAENDKERRNEASEQLPGIRVIEDYREGLSDEIDAVVIVTQTRYSFDIAMEAMKAGKHIFIEKPVAENLEKAILLTEESVRRKLILHCDHLMVYNHVIRYIKNMIGNGSIGDLMYIDISRVNLGPIRKDINAMLDLAVHDIAVVDHLLDGIAPDSMSVYGSKFFGDQETITYLTMKQQDVLISINSSWVSPVKVRRTVVAGTKKMLIFDDVASDKLSIYDSGIDVTQGECYGEYEFKTRVGDIHIPRLEFEDALLNSLEHFASCVLSGRPSLSGPEQCIRVSKVLEQAQSILKRS